MNRIEDIEKKHLETILAGKKITEFYPGDTVKVNVRIVEGKRQRVQAFEGVCIAKKKGGINSSFTVRKVSFGDTTGLSIKTKDPARRRNFRARHNCDNPGPKTKARYWSCRMWSGPDAIKNMLKK